MDLFSFSVGFDRIQHVSVKLMPEGLLNNLTEQQVRDLFTYLRVGQPLNAQ